MTLPQRIPWHHRAPIPRARPSVRRLGCAFILSVSACHLSAAETRWTGGNPGQPTRWTHKPNWSGPIPDTNDVALFSSATIHQPRVSSAVEVSGIHFRGGSPVITLDASLAASHTLVESTASLAGTGTFSTTNLHLSPTGTLALNKPIEVATLTGGGTIQGAVTVNGLYSPGGTLTYTPGTGSFDYAGSPATGGTQTITGGLTLGSESIFEWYLSQSGSGLTYSRILGGGGGDSALSIHTGTVFRLILDESVTFSDELWAQDLLSLPVFSGFSSSSGEFSGIEILNNSGEPISGGSFSLDGNSVTWTSASSSGGPSSPVPEPAGAIVGLLLAAGLLRRRR